MKPEVLTRRAAKSERHREVARHWIGGRRMEAGERRQRINPATDEVIGDYLIGGRKDAATAVEVALRAFRISDGKYNRTPRTRALCDGRSIRGSRRGIEPAFAFAGPFCMTGSRAIVQRGIVDGFRSALAERLETIRVGPVSHLRSEMGLLTNQQNVERVNKRVEDAVAAGGRQRGQGGLDGFLEFKRIAPKLETIPK